MVAALGPGAAVAHEAEAYLRVALLGVTPLLLMLAATGVLRGLQDTRTPLVVAVAGNVVNLVLNVVLVYGVGPLPGLGIAGSALGSVLAQVGCCRSAGARRRPGCPPRGRHAPPRRARDPGGRPRRGPPRSSAP